MRPGPQLLERLVELTSSDLFDVVIDASGNAASMTAGFDYVAHGGVYVLVSVVRDAISFADPAFHAREITLLASRNATLEDFQTVLDAVREQRLPMDQLISHRASLDECPERFASWLKPDSLVIKALIEI